MQVIIALTAGLLIFLWTRQLAGSAAGLMALGMWCFNPVVLAHGHLIQTDAGAALMFIVAVWAYSHFLSTPTCGRATIAGVGLGAALVTKLSALTLIPTFVLLVILRRFYPFSERPNARVWTKRFLVMTLSGYVVILLLYAPYWGAPPPTSSTEAAALEVPRWFILLRPLLIPADFFKAIALMTGTARGGYQHGYLFGEWSLQGWWYYYLVAITLKSPVPWLALSTCGLLVFLKRFPKINFQNLVPWVAAAAYMISAVASKSNVGVRHVLPVYALLSVGVAAQLGQASRHTRLAAGILCGWMAFVAVQAHPFYIEYFNEFVGGSKNGYRYLLDSNFDWGQDVKRLKEYLDRRRIQHVYLAYYCNPEAPHYYRIPSTFISAEQAQQIQDGLLVISTDELMRPEWSWLRQQRKPIDRVSYTLFLYKLGS